ncbi:hypothetical protein BGAL_0823g00010 [Botrytis galanthina]|uniref:Uncharacterized protein n=1 Tax=Botrytis galanthina TaxID=278940 RepID=A0A4S8QGP0_9HELO|nr:hypothetical protein BGAL_0823g00010 [Botrytis galanthina]
MFAEVENPYKRYDDSLCIDRRILPINEPAMIYQAMKTAFCGGGCLKFSTPASALKRKAVGELSFNTRDQKPEGKPRKVCGE